MKTILNTYNSYKTSKVKNNTTVEKWLYQIKYTDSKYQSIIDELRTYPKGHTEYERLKAKLPCITWNGTFVSNRKNSCLESITGLLFIDIDDCSYDINLLDKTKIFALWKSVGYCGWSMLVKCNGITKNNFKSYYKKVISDLGLDEFYDESCNDVTRLNVLSSDENIFINEECTIYDYDIKELVKEDKKEERIDFTDELKEYNKFYRLNNLDDIASELDFKGERYLYIKEGYEYIEANSYWSKNQTNNRTNMLLSYTNNLVWLNQTTERHIIEKLVNNANGNFVNPLTYKEVKTIIDSVYRYLGDGSLKPKKSHKKRKFIWNNNYGKSIKMEDVNQRLKDEWFSKSTDKLSTIISDWDLSLNGKITKEKIVKLNNISKKTVDKYWYVFKDYVKDINDDFKLSMKEYKN